MGLSTSGDRTTGGGGQLLWGEGACWRLTALVPVEWLAGPVGRGENTHSIPSTAFDLR